MKHLYLIFFLLLFSINGNAQGEYNVWCFGDSNLIDFNSGTPVHSLSSINAVFASSSICDKNGNLLFYSQDDTVWDSSHNMMLNGDSIIASTGSQCINILPFPCNDSLYYLFSLKLNSSNWPAPPVLDLYFSIINTNSNAGLGQVITKNILLDSNIAPGFAMTRHGNNRDYWITYQKADTNILYSRHINSLGINLPIVSQVGLNKSSGNASSTLKFSSNGQYLISTSWNDNNIQGYFFNKNTGILSSSFLFNIPSSLPIGVPLFSQFSPDLSKLYITGWTWLIQYDFNSGIISTIINSGISIAQTPSSFGFYDIALAPDNKIYIAKSSSPNIHSISQPNNLSTACGFVNNGFSTNGQNSESGFPTMLPNLFVHRDVLTDSLLCQYDTINLYLSDTNYIDSLVWSFGDTASGALNTSNDVIPLHVYNTYGTYPIQVIIFSGCVNDTIYDTIRINPTPIANLGPDTILCEGDSMQLLFNDTSFNYLWNTGDTTMSIQILNSGTFSIAISSICGVDYDTIVIDSLIPALVHLPNDTLMCDGDSLLLDATIQNGTYLWSSGDTTNTLWATNQNVYWVAAMNFCGSDTDTVVVNFTHAPYFDFGNDTTLCAGDTLVLFAGDTLSSVLWGNSDTTDFDTITTSGIYSVTTTNLCGTWSDSIEAWFLSPPTANLGNDTVLCVGDSVLLSDTTLFGNYAWSTGSVADTISVLTPGSYQLTVTNICGVASDTIGIDFDTIPVVNLGNDTVICNGNSVGLSALFSRSIYLWNTGSIDSAITATTEGTYWAITTNLCGADTDSVYINVDSILIVNLGPDTILCLGDVYPLHSNVIGDSYLWSTGSVADSIVITLQSPYSLTVTNVCGSFNNIIDVFYDNSPITNLGPDSTYCLNSLVNLNAYWSRAEYLWNTADTTSNITANYSGQFWVMVTNLCGFDDDTVKIAYDIPITFNLGLDTVLCVGDSILLAAPAHNANWVWNSGNTDSTLVVNGSGYYEVSATNICGTFTDGITVSKETVPVLLASIPDTSFCDGGNYEVSVPRSNAVSIVWLDGSTNFNRTLSQPNQYQYSLQNICGINNDSFNLHVEFPTNFSLGNDTILCYGEEIEKSFNYQNHTYLWNNGSTENFQTITRTGVYGVTILTPAHCESYDEFEVTNCNNQLFIPNAFTPGGFDDLNNTFQVQGVGIKKYSIYIYDRWGQEVFESRDITISWDGTFNGQDSETGVYSYKIWYNTGDPDSYRGGSVSKWGTVTLLR